MPYFSVNRFVMGVHFSSASHMAKVTSPSLLAAASISSQDMDSKSATLYADAFASVLSVLLLLPPQAVNVDSMTRASMRLTNFFMFFSSFIIYSVLEHGKFIMNECHHKINTHFAVFNPHFLLNSPKASRRVMCMDALHFGRFLHSPDPTRAYFR